MLVPFITGTHTTYNQNTPYLIGQGDVAMVTEASLNMVIQILNFQNFGLNGIFVIHRI